MTAILLIIAAAMASANIASRMVTWARRRALLDIPNERSSHSQPTPTGAGLGIVAVTLVGMLVMYAFALPRTDMTLLIVLFVACVVAAVSWVDDHRSLSAIVRLSVHGLAAGVLLGVVGPMTHVSLPFFGLVAIGVAAPVLTVWWTVGFANAFNFMDGIDGIAGATGLVAGAAWGIAGTMTGQPAIAALGWLIAGGCLGFLRHNWSPAWIFMGDVGAVFLGFMFAALTVLGATLDPTLALFGLCVVWPFVFDTAFTLARRATRRENLLTAHRSHVYQRLVIAGWSHSSVTLLYAAAAVASSLAGFAWLARAPVAPALVTLMLPGIALALWGITVSEEWRHGRASELDRLAAAPGFNHFARNRYILLADVVLIVFAAFAAFAMRFDGMFVFYRDEFPLYLAAVIVVKPLVFLAFGLYKRYWRYASVWDLVAVVLAVSAAAIVVGTIMLGTVMLGGPLFDYYISMPRSVLAIDWLVTLVCAGGVRMSVRVFSETAAARSPERRARDAQSAKRVLIVGAGEAGMLVLREVRRNPSLRMEVVGFLDDDPAKRGKRIHQTTVLGPLASLVEVAASHHVDEAVIALPTAPGDVVRRVTEGCREAGIVSRAVPGIFELLDGNISLSRLRSVEVGDLLRRAPVSSSPNSASYLVGQTVLVTGAGGSIGSELCHQVAHARPQRLILLGHGENSIFAVHQSVRERFPMLAIEPVIADVRDAARLKQIFERVRPSAVFHTAAHKHVPLMEENPEEAVTNNVFGTRNVVQAALDAGVQRLVMISTDKAVEPSSVMGTTKRIAESIVTDAAKRHGRTFAVVRFGNVLGSRGSVVPVFKRQIELGLPISITHPQMKRFFMTIPEAVHLVLQAGGLGRGGELFVLNMGQPVAIVDLAEDLIRLSGCKVEDVPIVFTGLRPGEKLEERLWEADAVVQSTDNPDVLRVAESTRLNGNVHEILAFLQSAVETGDPTSVMFALTTSVPAFQVAHARSGATTPTA